MKRLAVLLVVLTLVLLACNVPWSGGEALVATSASPSPAASPMTTIRPTATLAATFTVMPTRSVSAIAPGQIRRLTDSSAVDQQPAWSQDGRSIAFASNRTGNFEIYTMEVASAQAQRLTDHPAADLHPSWSADSAWIAFESDRTGLAKILLIRPEAETAPIILPSADSLAQLGKPEWSRAQSGLELASLILHEHRFREIVGLNLLSDRGAWLYPVDEAFSIGGVPKDPSWPADGERLVLVAEIEQPGNQDLYIVHRTTREVTRLTEDPGADLQPHWSPDGDWIAFASDREGDLELYVIRRNGTGLTRLTNSPGFDGEPNWSPDGASLAFSSDRDGSRDIYIMELELER